MKRSYRPQTIDKQIYFHIFFSVVAQVGVAIVENGHSSMRQEPGATQLHSHRVNNVALVPRKQQREFNANRPAKICGYKNSV